MGTRRSPPGRRLSHHRSAPIPRKHTHHASSVIHRRFRSRERRRRPRPPPSASPAPEPIESRTVRTALSARAIERTPSIDRSIDPAHFPSSHSRVIPRVPSLIASPARRSSRSSIARGAADASSREMRARRRTRARPTRAIDIARDGRGDIFRVARTRSLHAAAFPHAMVESCACDARLALGL